MTRLAALIASAPERIPGWIWGFAAGLLVVVVGPAAGLFAAIIGFVWFEMVILYFLCLSDQRGSAVTTPDSTDVRLLIRPLLLMGGGVAAIVVSLFARASVFYPPLEAMWLVQAVLGLLLIVVEPHLRAARFIAVADFLAHRLGEAALRRRVSEKVEAAASTPSRAHEAIMALPLRGVITTNYDILLSRTAGGSGFEPPTALNGSTMRNQLHKKFLLHLHGLVVEPESIVLSGQGYDVVQVERRPEVIAGLTAIFLHWTVMFVGFGFRDDHVRNALQELRHLGVIQDSVYALIPALDAVDEATLRRQGVIPIRLQNPGDFGVACLCELLDSMSACATSIGAGRSGPVRGRLRNLEARVLELLAIDPWRSSLLRHLHDLSGRPDLRRDAGYGFPPSLAHGLFDRVSPGEFRSLLVWIQNDAPHPLICNALSALPPNHE